MEMFTPATVKQARWLLLGGVFLVVIGVVRAVSFVSHGGVMFLVLAALFFGVGVLTLAGSILRIRRGDGPSSGAR